MPRDPVRAGRAPTNRNPGKMRTLPTRLARPAEWLFAVLVLTLAYYRGLERVPFHGDESLWISCSLYLEAAVDEGFAPPRWLREGITPTVVARADAGGEADVGSRESRLAWGHPYFSLDQPPVARYLIGIGRRLHGFTAGDLNRPWRFDLGPEENTRLGNRPSERLLTAARRSTAALSLAAGFLLYGLVRQAAGRFAGFLFVLLYSASGYLLVHLRRAMGDPALLFFTCLAMWAGTMALKTWDKASGDTQRGGTFRVLAWLAATGAAAGLAGGSKLNGLGVGVAGALIASVLALRGRGFGLGWRRPAFAAGASTLVLLACAATFVAVNPSLHSRPVAHLREMLELRAKQLAEQQSDPRWGLSTPGRRVLVVASRTLKQHTVTRVATLNALLAGFGLFFLARGAWRWTKDGSGPAAAVILLSVGLFTAGPALMTPVDWDRYYLFPVVFLTVLIAVGAARGPGEIRRLLAARAARAEGAP